MRIDDLQSMVSKNIDVLSLHQEYKKYLSRNNNIPNIGFLNRFLIYIQNSMVTDIKSELGWSMCGRVIKSRDIKKITPLYIIYPVNKITYRYKDTLETLKHEELSIEELNEALRLGYIIQENSLLEYKTAAVYDISDTIVVDTEESERYNKESIRKPVKLSTIIKACKNICNINIELNTNVISEYNYTTNTLVLNKTENSEKKLIIILKALAESTSHRFTKNYEIYSGQFKGWETDKELMLSNEEERKFIEDSILYSIASYIGIDIDIKFNELNSFINKFTCNDSSKYTLYKILESIEVVVYIILNSIGWKDRYNDSLLEQIDLMKRAENILSILEAHDAYTKIKTLTLK